MKVPSLSQPGTYHDVEEAGGRVTCSCPRFQFGPRATATCSHLRIYLLAQHAVARCRAAGHLDGSASDGVCQSCLVVVVASLTGKVRRAYVTKDEAKARIAKARTRRRRA